MSRRSRASKKNPDVAQAEAQELLAATEELRRKGRQRPQELTKKETRRLLAHWRLRRAKGGGVCTRCDEAYQRGDALAGEKGNWFHLAHLSPDEQDALWVRRSAGWASEVSGGGFETNRQKH